MKVVAELGLLKFSHKSFIFTARCWVATVKMNSLTSPFRLYITKERMSDDTLFCCTEHGDICSLLGGSMAWISTFSLFRGRLQSLEENVGTSTFQHDDASSRVLREHLKLWGQINKFSRQYFKSYTLKRDYGRRYLCIHCGVCIPPEPKDTVDTIVT